MKAPPQKVLAVVGCAIEHVDLDGVPRLLVLERLPHKYDGGHWGLPTGKVEPGESDLDAIIREIFEETGLAPVIDSLVLAGCWHGFTSGGDPLTYQTFRWRLPPGERPATIIEESAHSEHRWVRPDELVNLRPRLVHGLGQVFHGLGYIDELTALRVGPGDNGVFIKNTSL